MPTFAQLLQEDADKNGRIAAAELPSRYRLFSRPDASVQGGKHFPLRMMFGRIDSEGDGELTENEWNGFAQQFTSNLKDHGLLAIEPGGKGDITETPASRLPLPEPTCRLACRSTIRTAHDLPVQNQSGETQQISQAFSR